MASFLRIMVLIWADIVAIYIIWLMMVYLMDVWKLDFTHAAAIINILKGSVLVMPILFSYLADAFIGNFAVLLFTSLSYTAGLTLLWMSAPPVLANSYGNCKAYKPECVGDRQKLLFYTALPLIAVGMAGHLTSHQAFMLEQFEGEEDNDDNNVGCCRGTGMCLGACAIFLVPVAVIIVVAFVKPWATLFEFSAIVTMVSTTVFLSGVFSYRYVGGAGSPLTTIFRVFVASLSKLFLRQPRIAEDLYENVDLHGNESLAHTRSLRCLDKAAIILPNTPLEQQERNRWRLCRVTEVEETKIFIRMIPIWITFIVCGVVSSIGDTYFLAQAKNLNPKVGRIKVPLIILLWFYDHGRTFFSNIYTNISNSFEDNVESRKRYLPAIGIAFAMVFAVLCCITTAKVETRRLGIVKSHDLVDKPDERIPMSIFWLLPQFAFLGALDGLYDQSVASFFEDQLSPSMTRYMHILTKGVFGGGFMGNVLTVYIVGKVSQRGGKMSWFQSTLNHSRLDNYYWVLAALSAVNFFLFVLLAIFYSYRDSQVEEMEGEECNLECETCCC